LYSRWVDWFLTSDNSKFLPALRVVGGDPLPGSKKLGITYFLLNGWKIRPYEATHFFTLDGNLYCDDGSSPYVSTLGSYNVTIINSVSNLVDSTVQQLPEIEYASFDGGVSIDSINGNDINRGTRQYPVNTLTVAKSIATERGFNQLHIIGNITIGSGSNISDYEIHGEDGSINVPKTTITLTDGCTTSNTFFYKAKITGVQNGECIFTDCIIDEMSNTHCQYNNCILIGPQTLKNAEWLANHTVSLNNCMSSYNWYEINYNNSPVNMVFSNYSGKIKFSNITDSQTDIIIRLNAGAVWIDETCTSGKIAIVGIGTFINESSGTTTDITGLLQGSAVNTSKLFNIMKL